jgi:hypothetical protein
LRAWQTGRVSLFLRLATAFTCGIIVLPGAPAAAAPQTVCVLKDPRLDEVSGLVATPTGYIAMNDGKFGTSVLRLFVLDRSCRVARVITDRGFNPLDPEDLARSADGTLWVGDIGDNGRERQRIAVNRIPPGATRGTAYRLTYPDRAYDAEALLAQRDGRVLVVTKTLTGLARIYVSSRPLTGPPATVPLTVAGEVEIAPTQTVGGPDVGGFASTLVTGAALSADERRVVLRTYTDAYEWDVDGGDLAAAMTSQDPRRTALPGEPQGEAITFAADGSGYVTVSEGVGQPLRRWTAPAERRSPSETAAAVTTSPVVKPPPARANGLSPLVIGATGALGFSLLMAGFAGVMLRRRRDVPHP